MGSWGYVGDMLVWWMLGLVGSNSFEKNITELEHFLSRSELKHLRMVWGWFYIADICGCQGLRFSGWIPSMPDLDSLWQTGAVPVIRHSNCPWNVPTPVRPRDEVASKVSNQQQTWVPAEDDFAPWLEKGWLSWDLYFLCLKWFTNLPRFRYLLEIAKVCHEWFTRVSSPQWHAMLSTSQVRWKLAFHNVYVQVISWFHLCKYSIQKWRVAGHRNRMELQRSVAGWFAFGAF